MLYLVMNVKKCVHKIVGKNFVSVSCQFRRPLKKLEVREPPKAPSAVETCTHRLKGVEIDNVDRYDKVLEKLKIKRTACIFGSFSQCSIYFARTFSSNSPIQDLSTRLIVHPPLPPPINRPPCHPISPKVASARYLVT
jgi:hypothetical protein